MAEQLLLMADNLLLTSIYPGHTLTADSEAAGYPAWRVADGRRQAADAWRAATANADHDLTVVCDQVRAANCLVIDRESNHLDRTVTPAVGKRFVLANSTDNFTNSIELFDATVPIATGGTPAGEVGALTSEEAWVKTFPLDAATTWRLTSKAMGAGLIPALTGVWLGCAWQPTDYLLDLPLEDRAYRVVANETSSPFGWRARGFAGRPRTGTVRLRPQSDAEDEIIRWQILGLMTRGFPAWLIFSKDSAPADAMLVRGVVGDVTYNKTGRILRTCDLQFIEEQVKL